MSMTKRQDQDTIRRRWACWPQHTSGKEKNYMLVPLHTTHGHESRVNHKPVPALIICAQVSLYQTQIHLRIPFDRVKLLLIARLT